MVNFRIIEGVYEDIDFEAFKKDYMNMYVSKSEILEKYDLTHNRYLKYGRRVFKETGFRRRSGANHIDLNTNIRCEGKTYRVDKQINGKKLYCGSYKSLEDARKVRDFLVKHQWNSNAIDYCINGRLV